MNLSRYTLKNISAENVVVPDEEIFDLPEKILQFGTGRLLRGLPDYFIDKANRNGIFNGRILMIKSTPKGDAVAFDRQDGLYTLCERGIMNGEKVEENIIISSVSRCLIAQKDWGEILECAHNENLKIIISNTTEAGIQLVNENIRHYPPVSFPGKLLAFLYERFIAFNGSEDSGFVIIPTELISDNGKKLESIVLELAHLNSLEDDFIEWLEKYNFFCNSLVDRIVSGMPDQQHKKELENELGYKDELLIVSEPYCLWAIEGDEKIKNILSFANANDEMVIEPNIEIHRELKLRLLNGAHILTCGLAFLTNCDTVQHAMEDENLSAFISGLMRNEIAPSIPYPIDDTIKEAFISKVLDRFRNSQLNHLWENITLNYTSKMKIRCVPLLIHYYKNNDEAPHLFTLGFAAYLYFMKVVKQDDKDFYGQLNDKFYLIEDEMAGKFYELWKNNSIESLVKKVLKDESLWGQDLSHLREFQKEIIENLNLIIRDGIKPVLKKMLLEKIIC